MLASLDPSTAWMPRADRPLSWAEAAHLHRRSGFGATAARLEAATKRPFSAEMDTLFAAPDETFETEQAQISNAILAGNNPRRLSAWWLQKMLRTTTPLRENMALFWHGHFATSAAKVDDIKLMHRQYELFSSEGLGFFRTLLRGMVTDPAMLMYLDAVENRKNRPNENLARELMELFTLGVDRYSERDIKELARCLTGWQVKFGHAKFIAAYHDTGRKELLGQRGAFDQAAAVDVLLKQEDCGHFIAEKLIRHFVIDGVEIPRRLTTPLAQVFIKQGDIGQMLRTILSSRLFFSPQVRGQKIKSPVSLAIGLLRSFDSGTNFQSLANEVATLGQDLFQPPSVKGWPGGTTWINASTQLGRCNLAARLIRKKSPGITDKVLAKHCPDRDLSDFYSRLLLAQPIGLRSLPGNDPRAQLLAFTTMPEFQLA